MKIKSPAHWKEYELIDSGGFEKLERFGKYVTRRPEPQAVWRPHLEEKQWQKIADVAFTHDGSSTGLWTKSNPSMPDKWQINYREGNADLNFRLSLTSFKHVGIFPEQAENWSFIHHHCLRIKKPKVLNLFAYTGGASLAAKAAGADVVHCDSIKQVVSWARENMELSGLKDIRWLVEDAFKFVAREANRGNQYDGIILDPPAWGNGPKGEKWKLEEHIDALLENIQSILKPSQNFLVFNSYSLGFSALILNNLVQTHFAEKELGNLEFGELCLAESSGRLLPAGVFARFFN